MGDVVSVKTKDDLGKLVEGNWASVGDDVEPMMVGNFGRGNCFYEPYGKDSIMCLPFSYIGFDNDEIVIGEDGFGLEKNSKEYLWAKHLLSNNTNRRQVA